MGTAGETVPGMREPNKLTLGVVLASFCRAIATLCFLLVVFGLANLSLEPAHASERSIGSVSGGWVQTFTATAAMGGPYGMKLAFQCPDQIVYYRPSSGSTSSESYLPYADAGPGDNIIDFTVQKDPFPEQLATTEDRIHFRRDDGGTLSCVISRRNP